MIKAVIFDIDNTLYDFDKANVYGMEVVREYCCRTFGLEETRFQEYYRKAWKLGEQRVGTDTAAIHNRMIRFQCMMELMGEPLFPHVKELSCGYWDSVLAHMEPSPGIVRFCQMLQKKQIRIGVGTDMTAYIQYRKLEELGLSAYIDMIVTSEEAGVEKPHPDFFRLCVEKSGCLAEECAFIGDSLKKDVEGAAKSGLHGIWYSQGKEPAPELPYPSIRSFEEESDTARQINLL